MDHPAILETQPFGGLTSRAPSLPDALFNGPGERWFASLSAGP